MTDFLQTMAASSRDRAATVSASAFRSADFDKPIIALSPDGFEVIAEIKGRSPAEGKLQVDGDERKQRAINYAAGGAIAISVLTEPSQFDGDLAHLEEVVDAAPTTAVMRKDFLVDPVQILEARKAGASGVLLIAAILSNKQLKAMCDCAWEHGMFVLLESFDENDLERSSAYLEHVDVRDKAEGKQLLIGVNTRNLRTLHVDPDRLRHLAPTLPKACCVAESGLRLAGDAAIVRQLGYEMALVGTALMKSDDPAALIASMRQAAK